MRIREFLCAAGIFAVAGCGHAVEGIAVPADDRGVLNDWRSPAGTWVGSYQCAQGATGLTLTVQPQVMAEFEFYPLPENPAVPSGRFTMRWQVESGRIVFRQSSWIDRPGSYLMVDLVVERTESPTTLSGKVIADGCTTFSLTKDAT
ncbi:hypothetical protein ACFVVM_27080 [Nocardia sp. NPDC058176]|uniref:hypothetical protein n=1 Tax=Nocardia sp. NPDC058176 TaxID=3346368 RepID=UPI0036D98467